VDSPARQWRGRQASIHSEFAAPDSHTIFLIGLIVSASGVVSPPAALAAGLSFGLAFTHPLRREASALAKTLLQLSVIALGFGMNLHQVLEVGRSGFLYTAVSITASLALGIALGRTLGVKGKTSFLIAIGTAICGGSAIAATAPILDAGEEEISVALGTVFLLNSVALLIFPAIGTTLHLSQDQFGLWSALAIHDTSSVVGASAKYGSQALLVGTTVKLVRALWIIPASLVTAAYMRSRIKNGVETSGSSAVPRKAPWFILFFCLASVMRTYGSRFIQEFDLLAHLGKTGMTATLFLIGTCLSKGTVMRAGVRPLFQGVILWIIVATISLLAIHAGWISL
jgi:uncharacterized integral membrane protein (TIGR00698 family)